MDETRKKKIIAGAGIASGIVGIAHFLLKREPTPPGPPPGENYGRVWGYIRDAETDSRIVNARVYIDGEFSCYTDINGTYGTDYFIFGPHTLIVEADNYQTGTFPLIIEQSSLKLNLFLNHLPEIPTDWTEGIQIREIEVSPSVIYLGDTVTITVRFDYLYDFPLPEVVHGSVLVDDIELSDDFYNLIYLRVRFQYTPTTIGDFQVRAQDKSASFRVLKAATGTLYSPWGGVRMPRCTDILVPNVEPFSTWFGYEHPGGDLKFSKLPALYPPGSNGPSLFALQSGFREVGEKLADAIPVEWEPPDAAVSNWTGYFSERAYGSLTVMTTEYTCPEYWGSEDELANAIVNSIWYSISVPNEWILMHGKICPTCGGTGTIPNRHRKNRCGTCDGLGKVLKVDLAAGWRDWIKEIRYISICGAGSCTPSIRCPYCDKKLTGPSHTQGLSWDRISFVRSVLDHIKTGHPDHPLTEPAWF